MGLKSSVPPIGGMIRLKRLRKGSVNLAIKSIQGLNAKSGTQDPTILAARRSV